MEEQRSETTTALPAEAAAYQPVCRAGSGQDGSGSLAAACSEPSRASETRKATADQKTQSPSRRFFPQTPSGRAARPPAGARGVPCAAPCSPGPDAMFCCLGYWSGSGRHDCIPLRALTSLPGDNELSALHYGRVMVRIVVDHLLARTFRARGTRIFRSLFDYGRTDRAGSRAQGRAGERLLAHQFSCSARPSANYLPRPREWKAPRGCDRRVAPAAQPRQRRSCPEFCRRRTQASLTSSSRAPSPGSSGPPSSFRSIRSRRT